MVLKKIHMASLLLVCYRAVPGACVDNCVVYRLQ